MVDGEADDGGGEPELDLGERERGVLGDDRDVAGGHQPDAAGAHRAQDLVTTGLLIVTTNRCSSTIRRAPSSIPTVVASERSAPEQNTRSADRTRTTRTSGSASADSRCANSSVTSCRLSAFLLCGESSVIVASGPATS